MLPSLPPAMDTCDWRARVPPLEREKTVDMIMQILEKQHLPFSGPQGITRHREVASRFEERVFNNSVNQAEYLGKIYLEMVSIESFAESSTSVLTNLDLGKLSVDASDWRIQITPDAREKIVNKIMERLEKHHSIAESMNELRRFAARLEENVFNRAIHQFDYLRQISIDILRVEDVDSQNAAASTTLIAAANNSPPLNNDLATRTSFSDTNDHLAINTGDWRIQHSPDIRQKNINILLETLKKHVPYSGEEGIEELMRIAVSFEDLIFSTARDQVDYYSKLSVKMQTMERGD